MKLSSLAPWLLVVFIAIPVFSAQSTDSLAGISNAPPPGVGWQTTGGLLYGMGGMLAGGALGAGALSAYCFTWGEDCGFAGIGGAFLGGLLGFAGGFPMGVYRFGVDENHKGSLLWTYFSTVLGAAAGFGGTALITQLDSEDAWFQSSLMGLAGAPIGALIGFNVTRQKVRGIPEVAMVPLGDGGAMGRLTWRF